MKEHNDREWQTIFEATVTGNQQWYCGVGNDTLRALLDGFKLSQGYLYHYTNEVAASSIIGGEVWLTRADCFLDEDESLFGCRVLSKAVDGLDEHAASTYRATIESLRDDLRRCFVWSLSQDGDNEFLAENYAKSGAVIRLPSNLSFTLRSGWHATPAGDGFSLDYYASDIYDQLEGFVVYERDEQDRIAKDLWKSFLSIQSQIDTYDEAERTLAPLHLRRALMQCLILFKKPDFRREREYRFAVVRKVDIADRFEHERSDGGRTISYVKLRLPLPGFQEVCETRTLE